MSVEAKLITQHVVRGPIHHNRIVWQLTAEGSKPAKETKSQRYWRFFLSFFCCSSVIPDLIYFTFCLVLVLVRQVADSCSGDELHIRCCIHLKK